MENRKALLVCDMQVSILGELAKAKPFIDQVEKVIQHAREQHVPVIYMVAGNRKNAPEISLNNKFFAANREKYANGDPAELMRIHPQLTPLEGDIVIIKPRFGIFTGTDLEVILRAQRIEHLVLTGFATSGVILTAVREAADKDYELTVLSDCCMARDEEVHRLLMTKIFPVQAAIQTADSWLADLKE